MVEFSIPEGLPKAAVARLVTLHQDLMEGDITEKGYRKHREQILSQYGLGTSGSVSSGRSDVHTHSRRQSGFESILSYQMNDSPQSASRDHVSTPDLGELQTPLPPRGIPETAHTDPLNVRVQLSTFDNLPSILRYRGKTNGDIIAFQCLDDKGRDSSSITWGKLASKSEKVAQMLRDQSGLFRGDRVVLMYTSQELIEFVIALMGCFLAGLVAVPVSPEHISFLAPVLKNAQSRLVLTTETLHKRLTKNPALAHLQNSTVFWKTSDWGSYKSSSFPPLQVPDLAYIEFLRSSNGDLRGVVMSHRTILHQMRCLTAITQSKRPGNMARTTDRLLCSLDMRLSTGLILGVLLTVYTGNVVFYMSPRAMATPGLYAHVASRLRATILLSDYPALKGVCYNYQTDPRATRNFVKRHDPNLSHVKYCIVDVPTIDPEFMSVLTDRWLKPLGHRDPKSVAAPTLTLTEHGGMVISTLDFLTPRTGPNEVMISAEALSHNRIEYTLDEGIRVFSFGQPIPDAMVAVVDPETHFLSAKGVVGELWIDSPSLSGGFWDHADDTNSTFHARCYSAEGELPQDFLRTGLLGFLKDGMVFVLGTRVDRLVQLMPAPKYFYSQQLLVTVMRTVPEIYDGCIFQVPLKISPSDESASLLNVVLLESPKAPAQPRKSNTLMEEMANQTIAILRQAHGFKVYAVILCPPGSAPRSIRSGKPDIAKVAARRQLLRGILPASHIKFDLDGAEISLAHGDDVKGGIWGESISLVRSHQLEASGAEKQFSGVDMRSNVLDDRMSTSLDDFPSLGHVLQWRVRRQPDELALLSVGITGTTRETSWRQFGARVAAVYSYITVHLRVQSGKVACLIYTQSEDFLHAVYACFLAGIVVIPVAPLNLDRLPEDVGSLQRLIAQFKVNVLLGNSETHSMMEDKQLQHFLKSHHVSLPKLHNTSKAKPSDEMRTILGIKIPPAKPDTVALIWLHYTADHEYIANMYSAQQVLGMCKIQKETCQMSATKPIIGCVRAVSGLGFLYSCCLGVYMGNFTILVSPVDYANNPAVYFLATSRYKVKDGYGTIQMMHHADKQLVKAKGFDLSELHNLVIPVPGRADIDLVNEVRLTFASVNLETVAINLAYGPNCNPMVTTRSYMLLENIDLWLDPIALRHGVISVVNPNNTQQALHIVDSGMVPINTQVAIVNPETKRLCHSGELGEIWVVSEGNQTSQATQGMQAGRTVPNITSEIVDGEPGITYVRTGDFGFLHNITKGGELEMQVLFVAGPISGTFEFNGLQHFAEDLENTVISSNNAITDAVIAVCGGLLCCIVETAAPIQHLCALSAVVTNDLLVEHNVAPNVISFVAKDGIPRSRLGEKQRKTLLKLYTGATKSNPMPGKQFKTLIDFAVNPIDI